MNWMKRTWRATALGAVLGLTAAMAWAQAKKLDINFQDASLFQAVNAISRQTGIQFVIADRDKEFKMVTLSLKDVSADQAIELICTAAGAYADRDASGVYIIRFGARPTAPITSPRVDPAIPAPKVTTKVRMRHSDAGEVLSEILGRFEFDPDHGIKEAARIASFTASTRGNTNFKTNIVPPSMNVFDARGTSGPSTPVSNPRTDSPNDIWLPGDNINQVGGFGGGNFGGGGQPGGGNGAGGGGQNNQQQTNLQGGQGLVPSGIDRIFYDPTDNSLVVTGTDEAIRELRQLIDLFDVVPKRVQIKVEFITTSSSLAKSFGFDWQYSRGAVFTGTQPGTFARAGDPIFINYSTGNLASRLRAQLLEGEGKVVTAPMVTTFNNQSALVQQTINTTYFVPSVNQGAGGNTITYTPQPISAATGLSVRPRINDDGWVTMILFPQITDIGQVRRGPDGSEVPDTLFQGVQVATRVKDGDTMVLGGLNRTQNFSNTNRFPILSELPIIGQFFRSTRQERNDQELLIFVTPTIIKDDEDYIGP